MQLNCGYLTIELYSVNLICQLYSGRRWVVNSKTCSHLLTATYD